MSTIESIDVEVGLRYSRFQAGLRTASTMLDRFQAASAKRSESAELTAPRLALPAPAAPARGGGAPASPAADAAATADQLTGAILPLAAQIQSSITRAMAPLNSFAARFAGQFDKVGGTIIALARRIDQHMKFPAFEAAVSKTRGFVQSQFKGMEDAPRQWAQKVDKVLAGVQWAARIKNVIGQVGDVARKGAGELGKIKAPPVNFNSSTTTINNMRAATERASGSMKGFGVQVAAALGAFGLVYKSVGFLKDGVRSAVSLGETMSKTGEVFKGQTATVTAQAREMADAYGLPKGALLDAASAFGLMGKAAGKTGPAVAAFANEMTSLAADVMSFYNIPFDEAQQKLRSGLAGEAEPLRALGVNLDEASVKAEAFRSGIAKAGEELTQQQKIAARQVLIARGLATATGDLARTQDSAANRFRKLSGSVTNLGTEIGEALLPVVLSVAETFGKFFGPLAAGFQRNRAAVEAFAASLSGKLGAYVDHVMPALAGIGSTIAGAISDATSAAGSFLPSFGTFADGMKAFLVTIDLGIQQVIAAVKGVPAFFEMAFGSGAISTLSGIASAIKEWVVGAFESAAFTVRNFGDVFAIAQLQIGQKIALVIDNIALIPTNLMNMARFIKDNWLELMVLPFKNFANLIKETGKAVWGFWKGEGFKFDFDAVTKDMKAAFAKMPKFELATALPVDDQVKARLDAIAKAEAAYKARLGAGAKAPAESPAGAPGSTPAARGVVNADARADESPSAKAAADLAKFSEKLKDDIRTPIQEYRENVNKAFEALSKGQITAQEYVRYKGVEAKKVDAATPKFAGALQAGSVDARSAILAAMRGKPSDELAKTSRAQLSQLEKIAGSVGRLVTATSAAGLPLI